MLAQVIAQVQLIQQTYVLKSKRAHEQRSNKQMEFKCECKRDNPMSSEPNEM